eukprot:1459930-Lingulodinium_polyedra.AAC.1
MVRARGARAVFFAALKRRSPRLTLSLRSVLQKSHNDAVKCAFCHFSAAQCGLRARRSASR